MDNLTLLKVFPNLFTSFLRFSGVLPFQYSSKSKCLSNIYSLLVLTLCIAVLFFSYPAVKYFDDMNVISAFGIVSSKGSMLTSFVKLLYPMIISSTPIVAVINALWRYNRSFPKYFEYLQKADWFLKKEIYYLTKQRRFAVVFIACSLAINVLFKLFSVTSLVVMKVFNDYSLFWVSCLYFVDIVGLITEIKFVLMCNALRIRFEEINKTLENIFLPNRIKIEHRIKAFADSWISMKNAPLKKQHKNVLRSKDNKTNAVTTDISKTQHIFVFPFEKLDDPNGGDGEFLERDFYKTSSVKVVEVLEKDFSSRLHSLHLSHRNLSLALHHLKLTYEYLLLICIFSSFLMILFSFYFVIYGFVRVFFLSHRFDCFFWLLKSLVRFACPLIISDLTTKAAEKSLEMLHNYNSQSLTKSTSEEIHYFCQEIASRDLTITSVFNLFVLRAELITAAVAACTTYIVILVQLHTN